MNDSVFFPLDRDVIAKGKLLGAYLPDKHYEKPKILVSINWAGISNCRYFLKTLIDGKIFTLNANISVSTDLPPSMRGFNVSRNNEVIDRVIADHADSPRELNALVIVPEIAVGLLNAHEYAKKSYVKVEFDYPYVGTTPSGLLTHEMVKTSLESWAERSGSDIVITHSATSIFLGGALACPFSYAMLKTDFRNALNELNLSEEVIEKILQMAPIGTHMEHSFSTIYIKIPANNLLDFRTLVDMVSEANGTPFIELLKKYDELSVLKEMLTESNTRFAEDVVRNLVQKIAERYADLDNQTFIKLLQKSLFTFSNFSIVIEKSGLLQDFIEEVKFDTDT